MSPESLPSLSCTPFSPPVSVSTSFGDHLWAAVARLCLLGCCGLLGACAQGPSVSAASSGGGAQAVQTRKRTPAEEAAMRRYVDQVAKVLWTEWRKYHMNTSGVVRVRFLVNDGKVERVQMVDESQSFRELTRWTLYCVRNTTFPPMPESLKRTQPESERGRVWVPFTARIRERKKEGSEAREGSGA